MPSIDRRTALAFLLAAAMPLRASAQSGYPSRPIRIVVGFAAGGAPDALARIVAEKLGQTWGQPITVENRVGAQGNTAMAVVAKADPDGHTLALVPVGNAAVNPSLFANLPYDPVKDFAPVTQLASVENVFVVAGSSPWLSLPELIAAGRAGPAPLTYASPGAGSLAHLGAELLARSAGFSMTHVPYRGVAPALTDVLRGEISLMLAQLSTAKPLVESGQLRALAIASPGRSALMPAVPTVAEAAGLPGFEAVSWYALMAPAATPPAIVAQLNKAVSDALKAPDMVAALEAQGARAIGGTPAELSSVIAADTARWGRLVRDAGIQAN
jgi:tripartite-type tricarboxylate transporter receptor subunit TctC